MIRGVQSPQAGDGVRRGDVRSLADTGLALDRPRSAAGGAHVG